ncbi:hypothetical protein BDQ12DRAFT_318841 [Crucibulum laeve]|uniref:Uncharacterized protein n=1 Tax=Crucibulum laeve TaxID=68775 RepID=A0A5C3LRR9_9AGAR|nr:hypothetical protein BDQ12DRAFT_318841 [Crucibulum laeve]
MPVPARKLASGIRFLYPQVPERSAVMALPEKARKRSKKLKLNSPLPAPPTRPDSPTRLDKTTVPSNLDNTTQAIPSSEILPSARTPKMNVTGWPPKSNKNFEYIELSSHNRVVTGLSMISSASCLQGGEGFQPLDPILNPIEPIWCLWARDQNVDIPTIECVTGDVLLDATPPAWLGNFGVRSMNQESCPACQKEAVVKATGGCPPPLNNLQSKASTIPTTNNTS